MTGRLRWFVLLGGGALCAGGLGALVSFALSKPLPQAETEELDPVPLVVVADPALSPRSEGSVAWRDLRNGECLADFRSVDDNPVTLVGCDQPHRAEFVRAVVIERDPEARYPGDTALREFALNHCGSWEEEDLVGGEGYDDLVVQPVYSFGVAAWVSGDRLVGCLVYRSGGELIQARLIN